MMLAKDKFRNKQRITYQQLKLIISQWNINFRVMQKIETWGLKYSNKIDAYSNKINQKNNLQRFTFESLMYYFLKTSSWIIIDYTDILLLHHNLCLKQMYNECVLTKLKDQQNFQYYMVVTVKLISYFIGSHFNEIDTNVSFQCEIYVVLIQCIIGVSVDLRSYELMLKKIKNKKNVKERQSMLRFDADVPTNPEIKSKNNIFGTRRQRFAKNQTNIFHQEEEQENSYKIRLEKYKEIVKESLYVKPYAKQEIKKISFKELEVKENIGDNYEVKCKEREEFKQIQKDIAKKCIQSTQLSAAMKIKTNSQINYIKKFTVHCTPQKRLKMTKIQRKKYSSQEVLHNQENILNKIDMKRQNKSKKSPKHWQKVVTEIKENIFSKKSKYLRIHRELQKSQKSSEEIKIIQISQCIEPKNKEQKSMLKLFEDLVNDYPIKVPLKFRKLDLQNSSNLRYSYQSTNPVRQSQIIDKENFLSMFKRQSKYENKLSLHQLKAKKSSFQKQCEGRKKEIKETLFLPIL